MKSLFVGDLNTYGRSYQRSLVLKEQLPELDVLSHTRIASGNFIYQPSILFRIFWKLKIPLDFLKINKILLQNQKLNNYSFIWIDNPNVIYPWTLLILSRWHPKTMLIAFSEDDMYAAHGHSLWFRMGARFFNIIYTTKTYNLEELKLFGAKDIRLTLDSYCSYVHFSQKLSRNDLEKYKCDVSAIGAYESQRANSLLFLASNGIKICVWGSGWAEWVDKHPNLDVKNQFLFGSEYAKAICASTISINFLRKINRDEITSRSMEIPACGTFMIAERTGRHLQFFNEGVEAEFFNSDEELLKKIQFYLNNSLARSEIAKNGLKRCLSSGYGMHDQYSIIINDIYKYLNTHSR